MQQGIDLSHNNASFNWDNLSPLVSFVWMKATQGASFKDGTFQSTWQNCKAKNIKHGAYHFMNFTDTAQSQADNYLSRGIDFSLPNVLPPCIDIENQATTDLDNYIINNPNDSRQLITDLISILIKETGKTPIIYSYTNFFKEYLHNNSWPDCKLWLAAYQPTPPHIPVGWNDWLFWQFSEKGSHLGPNINGDVDWSNFNGSPDNLNALTNN